MRILRILEAAMALYRGMNLRSGRRTANMLVTSVKLEVMISVADRNMKSLVICENRLLVL